MGNKFSPAWAASPPLRLVVNNDSQGLTVWPGSRAVSARSEESQTVSVDRANIGDDLQAIA